MTYSPGDMIRSGLCIGCGSCVASTTSRGRMDFDRYGHYKPVADKAWLKTRSDVLTRTCPFSPASANEDVLAMDQFPHARHDQSIGRYEQAYAGYVAEGEYRQQGSSGGMVTWVAAELLRRGLVDRVAHVVPVSDPQAEGRFFKYQLSETEAQVSAGAKSRYYPVELSEIIRTIREQPGRYAIVGIPCFIKAVQLLRRNDALLRERITHTLGLFCGHMKSARFVESFAMQMNVPASEIQQVEFRRKNPHRPPNQYTASLTLRDGSVVNKDWWHLADGDWGAGFFMNEACNFCDDVTAETADISFGDAWVEPYTSDGWGTNIVVARSAEMMSIIEAGIDAGKLQLEKVSAALVAQTQAAGLRQRREGLAYRLTWATKDVQPIKRVRPDAVHLKKKRKLIYRLRYYISKWSHRMFWLAKALGKPGIYLQWARAAIAVYHGLAYHKGKTAEILQRYRQLRDQA